MKSLFEWFKSKCRRGNTPPLHQMSETNRLAFEAALNAISYCQVKVALDGAVTAVN